MALMEELKDKHLGEADGFSPEQRFFIGWAQMWCGEDRSAFARPLQDGRGRFEHTRVPEGVRLQANALMVSQKICRVW